MKYIFVGHSRVVEGLCCATLTNFKVLWMAMTLIFKPVQQ